MTTAKLFCEDGSQAVCLPPEFRSDGTEVRIRRDGRRVILEPIETNQDRESGWEWLDKIKPLDDDAVAAIEELVLRQEGRGSD